MLHVGLRRFWFRVVNKVHLDVGSGLKGKLDDEGKGPSVLMVRSAFSLVDENNLSTLQCGTGGH